MKVFRITAVLIVILLLSCEKKDKTFKIYHLKPNRVYVETDTVGRFGWYAKQRNDFFVVKNYDINNKEHKEKIDSFVLNELKKDRFLEANKNSSWLLTFFNYGDGIDENTKHEYGTDFTIHNLFSYTKEIGSFHFDNRWGYTSSNYSISTEKTNTEKRKILVNYFDGIQTLNPKLDSMMKITLKHLNYRPDDPLLKTDTIQVLMELLEVRKNPNIARYKVLKTVQGSVNEDTISISYSDAYKLENMSKNTVFTMVRRKLKFNSSNHYSFLDDSDLDVKIQVE